MSTILWVSSIVLVLSIASFIHGCRGNGDDSYIGGGLLGIVVSLVFGFFMLGVSVPVGEPKIVYETPDSVLKNDTCLVVMIDGQSYSSELAKDVNSATEDNVRLRVETEFNSYGCILKRYKTVVVLSEDELKTIGK